ncbi:hypothetical protein RQP46_000322 [Phenoliferia psychrophenolica]
MSRWSKLGLVVGGTVALGVADHQFNAEAAFRTLRTAYYGILMMVDFKLNFDPQNADAIHERAAERIYTFCSKNGSLYIKLAQSIAIQAAVLPVPYRRAFANIFDGAPVVSYDEVVKVFRAEFGVDPDQAFDFFEKVPIASASIAQVHRARLKRKEGEPAWGDDEGWVAVKVRKPSVPIQIEWDLFAYRALLWAADKAFEIPVAFVSGYVTEQMRKEVDLHNEALNATKTAAFLENEPSLKGKVLVPKVYWEWTGKSIMTADYIKACRLTDEVGLAADKLSVRETMDTATALFAAMCFKWGWLHSDLHPGNVLVRPNPSDPRHPQLILLDHGLYVPFSEKFRHEYCLLWRSLFVGDISTIENIAVGWGIAKENSEMFASLTLLRPHRLRKNATRPGPPPEPGGTYAASERNYNAQVGLKQRLKTMLEHEQLIPRELIFLSRTMRMMQANNQAVGSPTNRINVLAHWAADGLKLSHPASSTTLRALGLGAFLKERAQLLVFRVALFTVDFGFFLTQVRQWVLLKAGSKKDEGFEDVLQRQVTVAPNFCRVLAGFGILERLKESAVRLDRNSVRRYANDAELGQTSFASLEQLFGFPTFVVHRGDLHTALLDRAVELGAQVKVNSFIEDIDFDATSVNIKGVGTIKHDVLIGADGIKSSIRGKMMSRRGEIDHTIDTGEAAYRVILPRSSMENDDELRKLIDDPVAVRWVGPDAHIVAYPIKAHQAYNIVTTHKTEATDTPEDWTHKASKATMDDLVEWALRIHEPLTSWIDNNTVLLGDSAHATLPHLAQGAAQAGEDGAVLAAVLAKISRKADVPAALASYQPVPHHLVQLSKMSKAAQVVVDWSRITTKLGLHQNTLAALSAFRKRAADARLHNSQLRDTKTEIDFEHYRNILKNREVVAEGEKLFASFKPVDYDVSAQLKTIAAFEGKAIESAKQAATKIETELADLSSTLKNIEDARPFDQLTLDDVSRARPEVTKAVETMISQGKWTVPGYTEKFGNLSAI